MPQLTGMSRSAAAAAMVVGWRDRVDVRPEDVAKSAGAWAEYRDGLEPISVRALAPTFGLVAEAPRTYSVETNAGQWSSRRFPGGCVARCAHRELPSLQ